MRKYNIINNSLGWLCFVIAAVTYLLTVEPTASFWDCPEFISQGYKLEVGHPPGNPIFMLAARFFINFAGGDPGNVALAVNSMSALLSAGTILLLFWTITHLVRRILTKESDTEYPASKMIAIFGSGLVGALAYTWSDTFWFSAVEGEVYAFSSFCTALVFWLILKWENRADQPHSDSYLILIAYVIGISIAVHLLNLLCIPAIVLVFYYKKFASVSAKGSLLALCVSFVIVALILYGLVPGFIEVAQYFELLTVNVFGWGYNSGVLLYTVLTLATFIWAVSELYRQRSPLMIRLSFALSILFSGMPFIGSSLWIPVLIMGGLCVYLWKAKRLPVRILNIAVLSVFVIFIGYSSYALLLIRSSASTPMNQNAPDNVFDLASYLNREQYGERPLFYGQTFTSDVVRDMSGSPVTVQGEPRYAKAVKSDPSDPDRYEIVSYKKEYKYIPELNMLFPRVYDTDKDKYATSYLNWMGISESDMDVVPASLVVDRDGNPVPGYTQLMHRPTFAQNLRYFINYQLVHMYLRYFMWNFSGRQNDLQGNGEVNRGNWISGLPLIDNFRLGDQSYLPADWGRDNKGHNVFYMLPLLLGIIGLLWQAFYNQKGIEQFWVVFFLFFMTGIAIVLYLNQTPGQPRERDYAFAGSFYAFAIWIGMGVAALWRGIVALWANAAKMKDVPERRQAIAACVASVLGIAVPLQMVSQTWDDHDRSGRFTARDYGMNYLSSLDENAIIFTNGDNDTFPLWYAQEVEGFRTDVRVVNLSYLTTDWYANQQRIPSYDAPAIDMLATPGAYGQDKRQYSLAVPQYNEPVPVLSALEFLYSPKAKTFGDSIGYKVPAMPYGHLYVPVDIEAAVKAGRITADEAAAADTSIDLPLVGDGGRYRGLLLSETLTLDFLATSVKNGWNRPVYFAMTVPSKPYYMGMDKYMRSTGLAYEVTPLRSGSNDTGVNTDKMYRNVMERFRWGGLDEVKDPSDIYLDETVRRMVLTHRSALFDLAYELYLEGYRAEMAMAGDSVNVAVDPHERYAKALEVMRLMDEKLPVAAAPYGIQFGARLANLYQLLGEATADPDALARGEEILASELRTYAEVIVYYQHLTPWQYSSLPVNDQYIRLINYGNGDYDSYFETLLESYIRMAGIDKAEAMIYELQNMGVDFSVFPMMRRGISPEVTTVGEAS